VRRAFPPTTAMAIPGSCDPQRSFRPGFRRRPRTDPVWPRSDESRNRPSDAPRTKSLPRHQTPYLRAQFWDKARRCEASVSIATKSSDRQSDAIPCPRPGLQLEQSGAGHLRHAFGHALRCGQNPSHEQIRQQRLEPVQERPPSRRSPHPVIVGHNQQVRSRGETVRSCRPEPITDSSVRR